MFILDILLLKSDIEKLNLKELYVEWGGEFFSEVPPKFIIDEINYSKFDIYDNQFIVFLSEIWVKISKLYILILRDEEDIDKCYKIYELNEAAEIIKNCLNFKTSLGVVIEKKIN